jgi:hypothetical protein
MTAEFHTAKYVRKPFDVEAIQVTEENMEAVAFWCNGALCASDGVPPYVQVWVKRAQGQRQTQAYVGDWVLYSERGGFKVYLDKAFRKTFDLFEEVEEASEVKEDVFDEGDDILKRLVVRLAEEMNGLNKTA